MPFAPTDLAALEAAVEIEIETRASADAPVHRTIIWVVTDDADAFIRSARGGAGRWYREAVAHPEVVVHLADRSLPARAIPAADATSIARTNAALARKYPGIGGLAEMLVPEILDTTLRLEPA